MRNRNQAIVGVFAGGLLSLGTLGFAYAQTDSLPRLDIVEVTQELDLSEETGRELSPLLDKLNAAFERREEHWRQADTLFDEIAETYDEIAETLSASELREFHLLLWETTVGLWAGRPMGRYYNDGRGRFGAYGGRPMRGGRGGYCRGMPMRGMRWYDGQQPPMRGIRGTGRWDSRPGWRPDDNDPNS